ncbi:MAG: helix-turn-helix domain-containing protein [Turicibacter sp.]|nr:helix-turn-helix domain-containing protein [Turicibacter sp.]
MDFSNKENNQQLADYLREQRQNRHLNLEDVADKIGVPIQHLKNIENGNFDRFDTFYLKMYIKKYATYLSLNVEELYQQFYGTQIQKEVEVKIHKQKVQKRNRNLGRVAGLLCAVLVIALGVFYVVDVVKNATPKADNNIVINNPNSSEMVERDEETPETLEDTTTQVPEEKATEEKPQEPVTTVSLVSQQSKEVIFEIVTDQTEADLKLDFTAPCWLSLTLGDQSLIPGETYQAGGVFEQKIAGDQFGTLEFNVGDATAVKISVNNQVIDFEPSTPHQYIKINIKTE